MPVEAALDANAPVDDEDDATAGPVDSDEETAAVMGALSKWTPQPLVPQPTFLPVKRQYQLARLREQLHQATSGGRVNIFKVTNWTSRVQRGTDSSAPEVKDAPGELDTGTTDGGIMSQMPGLGASNPPVMRQASVASRG